MSHKCPGLLEGVVVSEQNLKNSVDFKVGQGEMPVERDGADSVPSQEKPAHLFKPGQSGNPAGKPKGLPNKITRTIRDAVMAAVQPGACHEKGFEGWLIERANGGIEDRKIFAGVVSRVIPVEITGAGGGPVKIDLGWLTERRIGGGDVIDVTPTTQNPANPLLAGGATDVISETEEK